MIKHYAVLTLQHLLDGVDECHQEIFINLTKREEICYEDEETRNTTTKESGCDKCDSISDEENDRRDREVAISDETNNEGTVTKENKIVGKTRTSRTVEVKELTRWGKRFINSMMDQAQTKNLDELSYTERENYLGYLNPTINFFRLLDIKGEVYLNNDARLYSGKKGQLLDYPIHEEDNMDWYTDENGDILPFMSSADYNRTWKQIMDASNVQGMQQSMVNKKLMKEDKSFNDIKCAYHNGRICEVYGNPAAYDDIVFAMLNKAEWKIQADGFLTPVKQEPELTELAIKQWLCSPLGSKGSDKSTGRPSKGGKFDRLNKKNKAKKQNAQPSNDAKADAMNPNHQD